MEPVLSCDFDVSVDQGEVLRLLGVPKRGRDRRLNAPEQALDLYPAVLSEALSLVKPKAIYTLCPLESVRYHVVFRKASHLAFAVCTIGPHVEAAIARSAEAGESLKALIMDAMGSVAVESVVEQTAVRIKRVAESMGLRAGVRFSPGYGKWPLEEQRRLFGIVDGGAVGVGLNDSCIMEPRKSVSFAMRIGEHPDSRD